MRACFFPVSQVRQRRCPSARLHVPNIPPRPAQRGRQAAKLATALVEWPLCGAVPGRGAASVRLAVVELTLNFSVGRGLFNGARCVVSKVGRDALEVHLLGPARKLQGMTSPVTVPRASVTPDGSAILNRKTAAGSAILDRTHSLTGQNYS